MTKQKKPKVGDTVGWYVVDANRKIAVFCFTRGSARRQKAKLQLKGDRHFIGRMKIVA